MKAAPVLLTLAASTALVLLGCSGGGSETARHGAGASEDEGKIQANLAKLDPEDRKLAEAQKFCPIESDNRLGAMGKPVKVMVKDQPVFVCCKQCEKKAVAEPDKTLAKVKELKGGENKAPAK